MFFEFFTRGVAKVPKHAEHPSGKHEKIAFWHSVGIEFSKSCFKLALNARFHFGGEWVVYTRILMFLLVFGSRLAAFGIFNKLLQRFRAGGANRRFRRELQFLLENMRIGRFL